MDVMSSSNAQVLEVASILPQTQKACCAAESPALVVPEQGACAFLYGSISSHFILVVYQ